MFKFILSVIMAVSSIVILNKGSRVKVDLIETEKLAGPGQPRPSLGC